MHKLFLDEAKRAVRDAVEDVERRTSAEVLVTVRRVSGNYRHADLVGGAILAMGALCLFLYYPEPFDYTFFPLEQAGAFLLGALVTWAVPPLRRRLAGKKNLATATRTAARAAFVDLGVGKTNGRNGVLVYISAFERSVEVVCDVGIDEEVLGVGWRDVKKKLDRAVRLDDDVGKLVAALKDLGPVLATKFPRRHDDVNELGDHVADDADLEVDEDDVPDADEHDARRGGRS